MPAIRFVRFFGWLLFVTMQIGSFSFAVAGERPNVVLIISDDQAWTDFGFMGHETIQTPNLDRLARQSAVFTRGYVPVALCRPSLVSMVTGLYPHQHRITGNDPRKESFRKPLREHFLSLPRLPELLAGQGYASFQTGKWWEGNYATGGFTQGMTHGDRKRGGRHGDVGLKIGRQGMKPIFDFIDQHEKQPFFIWYAPFLPHRPHNPPERLVAKYKQKVQSIHVAKYYAMCDWFDETCGQLLEYLDKKKLSDNTLVLFVVDNGWIQNPRKEVFAPRSKRSPNEAGIRSPILLRWPKQIQPLRSDQLVSSVDLMPTVLAACGAEIPTELPGKNLLAACQGKRLQRERLFGYAFDLDILDPENPAASLKNIVALEQDWKLIAAPQHSGPAELYNLVKDPHERKNLAAENPEKVKQLRAAFDKWWPGSSPK